MCMFACVRVVRLDIYVNNNTEVDSEDYWINGD